MIYGEDSRNSLCAYKDKIVVTKNKKIYIYDKYGKEENCFDVEINNAIYDSSSKYLAVAEKDGKNFYVIYKKGIMWQGKMDVNIEKIEVNKNGYVAIKAYDSNYKSIIILYNSEGKEQFRKYISNTVVDIGISEDNNYLAYAELNTNGVLIQSNIKVISIEKAIKDSENSLIYSYNADINKLILNIEYQANNKLVCMYDNSIDLIENNENKELINFKGKNVTLISIEFEDVVAIVEENSNNNIVQSKVTIINTTNRKEKTYTEKQMVKEIYVAKDVIALNFGKELHVVARNGWLVKKYISKREINDVIISSKVVGIVERNRILAFGI